MHAAWSQACRNTGAVMHQVLSLELDAVRKGLVTCSTGNHALAFLHACSLLPSLRCLACMPPFQSKTCMTNQCPAVMTGAWRITSAVKSARPRFFKYFLVPGKLPHLW